MTERIVRDAKNRSAAARFVEAATAEHAQKNRRQKSSDYGYVQGDTE